MICINLGSIRSGNVQPNFAYGILRSCWLPLDSVFLAAQGLGLGAFFGNPVLGAKLGAIMSVTDRFFTPPINRFLPAQCYQVMGLPLGLKNIVLAGASLLTASSALKAMNVYFLNSRIVI